MDTAVPEQDRRLEALLAVARSAASTLELAPLLNNILDTLKLVVDYAGASIGVVDGDDFRFLESRGASAAERETELIGVRLPLRGSAVLWEQLSRHQPVIIDDVRGQSDAARAYRRATGAYYDSPAMRYVRSFMAVPLVNRDRLVGLLTLSSRETGAFTPHHAGLAMAIATHIAAALENARLYEEARAAREALSGQIDRLMTLGGITQQLLAATELDAVLSVVVESTLRFSGSAGAAVSLIDESGETVSLVASAGEPREYFEGYTSARLDDDFLRGTGLGLSLARREAVVIEDYAAWLPEHEWHAGHRAAVAHGVRAFVAAPLLVDGVPIGSLRVIDLQPRVFPPEDVALIQALADQAALAIEHARLLRRDRDAVIIEERTRLARDLHDSVTQSIFSLGMLAQAARTQHERGSDRLGATLERISSLAQEALIEMRTLLFELQPAALSELGLAAALERLVAAMELRGDLRVTLAASGDARLDPDRELALFRIAQESLANALKHARATEVSVTLEERDGGLCLTVADNGVGFDPSAVATRPPDPAGGGMGLRSMRERAAAAGIILTLSSAPSAGVTVRATAPILHPSA